MRYLRKIYLNILIIEKIFIFNTRRKKFKFCEKYLKNIKNLTKS